MFWEDVPAPNKTCKTLAEYAKLYCLLFFILSIAKCFAVGVNFLLSDLLSCLILFLGLTTFDSCFMTLFVFFTFLPFLEYVSGIGLLIQRGFPLFKPMKQTFMTIGMVVSMIVYVVGWWLSYACYKEFKAASYGLPNAEGWQDPEYTRLRRDDEEDGNDQRNDRQPQGNFSAFQGQGVAIG